MKDITLYLFNYAEILALLTSISCIKWLIKTPLIYFFPYLLMTVAVELFGLYASYRHWNTLSNQIYNVTTVVEFSFFYFLFFKAIKKQLVKKIILLLSSTYVITSIINILFLQGFNSFSSHNMLFGTLLVIIFVFFYFYYAFENNEPTDLLKEPMFWISLGVFLFSLGDFTFDLMLDYLQQNHLKREQYFFQVINHNLVAFEYICFSIALIISSKNRLRQKHPPQSTL